MNVKVLNMMSGVNEANFLIHRGSCECKCRLNESVCNSKQKRNHIECRCDCKGLDDWGSCGKGYMWNPSMRDCECNIACKIDQYLDIKNCSSENRLTGKFVL